jgi:hypothetical protein
MTNAADLAAIDELATRLFDAFEQGDVATAREVIHPDARIQNPFRTISGRAVIGLMQPGEPLVPQLKYDERVRYLFADGTGFAQQHVARAQGPDGVLTLPACVIGIVEDGMLVVFDMYYDTAVVQGTGLQSFNDQTIED